MDLKALAELIFPDIDKTPEHYIKQYPKRELSTGARVTRYAPSPTGFQHIGGVFSALIDERIATQSGGVFYLRIEDTDQKREIEGAIEDTIVTMHHFGMDFNEGMTGNNTSKGAYGPYRQSQRAEIYKTFAKELIQRGAAYPCFCTPEELSELREKQTAQKLTPGYYGEFALCRDLSPEQAMTRIQNGEAYILRFKSPGNLEKRVAFHDLIKGDISFPENNQDIVLIKGDGLPTYHFAHVIDDFLMGTTDVIRGEEWLSSLPIHVQLFETFGYGAPNYAHTPTIMKQDGASKRKLSKRKDPEAAVAYYQESGYPVEAVVEYLLNIINSGFENWRTDNPLSDCRSFEISLEKMSKSGALFDLVKLNDVSKEMISRMNCDLVFEKYVAWAEQYDPSMFKLVTEHETQMRQVFNIDKEGPKPRKDFAKWADVKDKIFYYFDELFAEELLSQIELPAGMELTEAKRIIEAYGAGYRFDAEKDQWFDELKAIGENLGYCTNKKEYKANPEAYRGMIADVAGTVRAAITHRANTPDLYTIMQVMGETMVRSRFNKFLEIR